MMMKDIDLGSSCRSSNSKSRPAMMTKSLILQQHYLPPNEERVSFVIKNPCFVTEATSSSPSIVKNPLQIAQRRSSSLQMSDIGTTQMNCHHQLRRHHVQFDDIVQVKEFPHSAGNHRSLFWSQEEFKEIHREKRIMGANNVCTLGLYTPGEEKRRKEIIRKARKVVLRKGSSSSLLPQLPNDEYGGRGPEHLSVLYWECTRQNQWEATQRGAHLAHALQGYKNQRQQCLNKNQHNTTKITSIGGNSKIGHTATDFYSELPATPLSPRFSPPMRKKTIRVVRRQSSG